MPVFLFFGLALSWVLLIARTEAALREAVDEAVKTTAAHAYPLDLIARASRSQPMVQELESQLGRFLPYPIKVLLQERTQNSMPGSGDPRWSRAGVHQVWAAPLVMRYADEGKSGTPVLDASKLAVRGVVIPDFMTDETSYFGLSAEYRLTLPIPWVNPEIVITAAALERCWVGGK